MTLCSNGDGVGHTCGQMSTSSTSLENHIHCSGYEVKKRAPLCYLAARENVKSIMKKTRTRALAHTAHII